MPQVECVADTKSKIGEGALWDHRTNKLWWVDIPAGLLHAFDPATGSNVTREYGEPIGCLALRQKGGLVLATKSGFHLFNPETGKNQALSDPEGHLPDNRFNDGSTDRNGRFWAGTMKDGGEAEPLGTFYRLDSEFRVQPILSGFYTTNGLAFSPDGETLYASDSHPMVRTLWTFDYDIGTGTPSNRRVFVDTRDLPGRPDGGTVDTDGCYWMAAIDGGRVIRFTPDGRIDREVKLPVERPSKPMFGGPNLDILFVTSLSVGLSADTDQPLAGGLFAITGLGVQGLPEAAFPG